MKLWIQFWNSKTEQRKKMNAIKGLDFLKTYKMSNLSLLSQELSNGLEMTPEENSNNYYKIIMPNNQKKYIRIRLSNHPFDSNEWLNHELDGLPNVRYSIFIYNGETCPQFKNQSETDWRAEYSENIPVYEKGFNEESLSKAFPKLLKILLQIYNGKEPQPKNITLKIKKNEIDKNKNYINLLSKIKKPLQKALLLIKYFENK